MTTSIKQLERTYRQTYRRMIAITFAYVLVVAGGIALLVHHPKTADWASQVIEAEFAAMNVPPSH